MLSSLRGERPPLSQLRDPVCLLNGSSAMFPLIMTSMKVKNVRCGFSWRQLTPRHRDSGCFINDGGETTNESSMLLHFTQEFGVMDQGFTDWDVYKIKTKPRCCSSCEMSVLSEHTEMSCENSLSQIR